MSWNDGSNWGGFVPGPNDDACIPDLPGYPPVRITTTVTVKSINCDLPLVISGASLTVTSSATTSTVTGATTLTGANLYAQTGAKLIFQGATTYTGSNTADTYIQATGAGSMIDLSHLQTFQGGGFVPNVSRTTHVLPTNGGEIDLAGAIGPNPNANPNDIRLDGTGGILGVGGISSMYWTTLAVSGGQVLNFSGLTSLNSVNLTASAGSQLLFPLATTYIGSNYFDTYIQATGAGSKIDLSHLQTFRGGGFVPNVSRTTHVLPTNGGEIDLAGAIGPNPSANPNDITLDGTGGILGVAGVTSIYWTSLTVGAGHVLTFSALPTLSNVNVTVSGGSQLSFPLVTSYTGSNYFDTYIQATGAGSKIDLSHLQTFRGGGFVPNVSRTTHVLPTNGGEIDLAGDISVNSNANRNDFTMSGADSKLGVAEITKFNDSSLAVTTPGALTFPSATEAIGVSLSASTGVVLTFSAATALSGNISAAGGAMLLFPAATSYTGSNYFDTYIQATGAGSKIDLSHLQTFQGGGFVPNVSRTTHVLPTNSGRIDLAGAIGPNPNANPNDITLDGTGGILGVAGISSMYWTTLAVNGGQVLNFSGLTSLNSVNLAASAGSQLLFPLATTYIGSNYFDTTISASGSAGPVRSKIDLSHLQTFRGGGFVPNVSRTTHVLPTNGGEIDLAGDISVNSNANRNDFTMSGADSKLEVILVTSLANSTLTAGNGATLVLPYCWRPMIGSGVAFATSGTGQIINRATLVATGVQLTMNTTFFSNQGVLDVQSGGTIAVNGSFQVDNPGILQGAAGANFRVTGNMLGNTQNRYPFTPRETVTFQGTGTLATPQQLEVMSEDRGATSAGFQNNFVYTSLALGNNTRIKLVDLSDNFAGAGAEALYVIALTVPAGCTLDLNGFHVYARMASLGAGTIVDTSPGQTGAYTQVLDAGPPGINVPRGFENNLPTSGWTVDNGVWAVGVPTSGPPVVDGSRAHQGAQVAATVLAGDYPAGTNSRLITSSFMVPAANQNPRLRFWNWFLLGGSDYGAVEIRVGAGAWTPLSAHYTGGSVDWQRPSLDLGSYAGQTVQVAFHLVDVAQANDYQNPGWYLDEVEVATGVLEIPQVNVAVGFENGMGDWWADNSVWEAGHPTGGPGAAHPNCVGTALAGPCPSGTQSRLVSPVFTVPGGSNYDHTTLWFSQWHDFGTGDAGYLQVSVFDGAKWGPWINFGVVAPPGASGGWKDVPIDLTPYRGKTISLGFLYSANDDASLGAGWFIDDIKLQILPDTDGDGLVDLLEQAFGPSGEPRVVKENGYLTVTITKQAGVPYSVETAGNLEPASWSASTTTVLIDNATTLKVRDNVLIGTAPMRFMRVRVTETP